MAGKRKEISLEKMLGGLTPEQRKEFAQQFNPSQAPGAKRKPVTTKKSKSGSKKK